MIVIGTHKNLNKLIIFSFVFFILININVSVCSDDNYSHSQTHSPEQPKDWTVIIYMAADNDLRGFAARNIKQMAAIGSNDYLNIAVQLDIKISGNKKITRRYYIEKDKILHVNADDPHSQKMDSGDPQTLISCCNWAINDYPAHNYALIFWNHGTGPLDPASGRIINPTELFTFNPVNNKFELDRTIGFLDFINAYDQQHRGICWDDSTGNYLTNQKLDFALNQICNNILQGKKFSIIGFDACLMSTIEIANIIKPYANIMVGSQEVELGTGWNYQRVFSPFQNNTLDMATFAQHIVRMYAATYNTITDDYTQSAVDLSGCDALEQNINTVSRLLIESLKHQKNSTVKNAIQVSRSKELCTHFDEPSYLDLHHLYTNLKANLKHFGLANNDPIIAELDQALRHGCSLIKNSVLANTSGKNLSLAQGISIYFPERRIHYSYKKTTFATNNTWFDFLTHFLSL
ncbi:MAG TPA: clostripain-related cysteine peptidase [Candidatus Babeliales bacterium]|nr:clostripain-related cysteine peptidase [Candidatus Babeliales bacterium]